MSKFLKGFSLLELLVSLLISSLISTMLLKLFNQTNEFRRQFQKQARETEQIINTYRVLQRLALKANYGYFRPMSDYRLSSYGKLRYGLFCDLEPKKKEVHLASEVLKVAFLEEQTTADLKKMTVYVIADLQRGEYFMKGNHFALFDRYDATVSKIFKVLDSELYLSYANRGDKYPTLYLVEEYFPPQELIHEVKQLQFRFAANPERFVTAAFVSDWDKIKYLEVNLTLPKRQIQWFFWLENKG